MARLQRGDLVKVTGGNDKGKQGRIKRVLVESDKVVIEGVTQIAAGPPSQIHTSPTRFHRADRSWRSATG